jgi:DNA-binding phage protein
LMNRPEDSYEAGEETERKAVANYRDLVDELYAARADQDISLRSLAEAAGVAVSGVAAMDSGSVWPRLNTMRSVAEALGLELHIEGDPDVPGHLVRHVRRTRKLSLRTVAIWAGQRPNTVSELGDPTRSPSMRTILAVAVELGLKVELRPTPPATGPAGDRRTGDEGPVS